MMEINKHCKYWKPHYSSLEIGPGPSPKIPPNEKTIYFGFKNYDACDASTYNLVSEMPMENNAFDYILFSHVLEHISNPIQWLVDSVIPLLREDGLLSIAIPGSRYNCPDRYRMRTPLIYFY